MSERGKLYAFLSPIRKTGPRSFKFSVLQPGGKPALVLEYNTKEAAKEARKQLLTSRHTFGIPTNEFFIALSQVLYEAQSTIVPEDCL